MKTMFFTVFLGLFSSLSVAQTDDFKSLVDKGDEFVEKQDISMALDCYDKALALGTDNTADMVWVASVAGIYAQQANEPVKALSFFRIAADHGCTDQDVFDRYIKLAGQSGDKKQEEYAISAACRNIEDNRIYTEKLLHFYYNNGQFDKVITISDSLQTIVPQTTNIRILKALALEKTGKTDEAVVIYEDILANEPNNEMAISRLGLAYYNKAVDIYETAKARYVAITKPTKEQYATMKMQFDVAMGFYQKSVTLLEKIYQDNPALSVKELLHKAYSRLGNKEKVKLYQ